MTFPVASNLQPLSSTTHIHLWQRPTPSPISSRRDITSSHIYT